MTFMSYIVAPKSLFRISCIDVLCQSVEYQNAVEDRLRQRKGLMVCLRCTFQIYAEPLSAAIFASSQSLSGFAEPLAAIFASSQAL